MFDILINSLKQRILPQTNTRIPEPIAIMSGKKQTKEYNISGEIGSLAPQYELIITKLLKISSESGNCLDICCGTGQLLCKTAKEMPGMSFIGIDLSLNMLNLAKTNIKKYNLKNVKLKKMNMFEIDKFNKDGFDLITWNLSAHHCNNKNQVNQF